MIINANEYTILKKAKSGDKLSEEQFLNNNLGLVRCVAKRFYNRGTDLDDIIQLGMLGLYKAIKNFDFSYNVKFSTYAVPMISGEIKRFLRDDGIIKVSRSVKELSYRIKLETERFELENNRQPAISELAKVMDVDSEDIVYAISATDSVSSLDDSLSVSEDKLSLIDKIVDSSVETEEQIIDKITLKELLETLKPRERQIIIFRYFKGMTQQRVADILKISQVQVCRIEKKVLGLMRKKLIHQ